MHVDQLRFVADHEPVALVILAKAYVRPGGLDWQPYVVMHGDLCIGFLALAFSESACELYHLAIDVDWQSRGFGTAALATVVQMAQREHPECRELSLTVNPENIVAQALYRTRGFHASGETRHGEPVWRLPLRKPA